MTRDDIVNNLTRLIMQAYREGVTDPRASFYDSIVYRDLNKVLKQIVDEEGAL